MLKDLDIGEVAKDTGLPPSTLRYYEEKGLIKSIGRDGLRRVFKADVIDKIRFISLSRHAGFSLKEIGEMFSPEGRVKINRTKLVEKADDLDLSIKKMIAMRDGLRHAAKCPETNHFDCPTFNKFLRIASKKRIK